MEKNDSEKKRVGVNRVGFFVVAIILAVLLFVFVGFYITKGSEWGLSQIFGILVSAAASGLITFLLLLGQTDTTKELHEMEQRERVEREAREKIEKENQRKRDSEERESFEKREKNVKGYEQRIQAFSHFCENAWSQDLEENGSKAYVEALQKSIFGTVLLYLDSEEVKKIAAIIKDRGNKNTSLILSSIVKILKDNVEMDHQVGTGKDSDFDESCKMLWNEFQSWASDFDEAGLDVADVNSDTVVTDSAKAEQASKLASKLDNFQTWHFIANGEEQFTAEGNELSLIEYGEGWRTALVQAVKPNDLVFLFRRGGYGYVGLYRAKGWRVFEYDQEAGNVEEIVSEGIARVLPAGKVKIDDWQDVLAKHDFYYSFGDGGTSCANLVAEQLAYVPEGIGRPVGGVYRRAISRYDRAYAAKMIEVFAEKDNAFKKKLENGV